MRNEWPREFPGANWLDEREEAAVLDVLRHGSLFRYYGPGEPTHVAGLEAAACEFYGVRHAQAVNSGTGALMTALGALGIGPGDEVIVPSFMWVATVTAVVRANAIPVICEVDDTFGINPADLEKRITRRTRLIIAVHMAGAPADMDGVMSVAGAHGIPVLEDCAQANGGHFRGKKLGTFGKVSIFSFQLNKNATAGEGGLIVTDDSRLYKRIVAAHDIGVHWIEGGPKAVPGAVMWGQGRRMSELCGAVARVQLSKLPEIVGRMRASKRRILDMLAGTPGLSFRRLADPDGDTGAFIILMLDDAGRAMGAAERMQQAGLGAAVRLEDYHLHIYFNISALVDKVPLSPAGNPWSLPQNADSVYDYSRGACPVSDELFARSVLVPVPSRLDEEQERRMADVIRAAVSA